MDQNQVDRRVAELIRLYTAADSELQRLMLAALQAQQTAKVRYRARIMRQVREILDNLKKTGEPYVKRVVLSSYELGARSALAPGSSRLRGAFGGPHTLAIDELTKALDARLEEARVHVGRSVRDVFRQETLRIAAERLATGENAKEGAKALVQALERKGETAFVDRRGRQWSLGNYAGMAIQTTSREAQSQGLKNKMLENEVDLVKISSHIHKPDVCSPYDGKTFSLTGSTPGYPVIDKLPPFHPRCRHVAVAAPANFL